MHEFNDLLSVWVNRYLEDPSDFNVLTRSKTASTDMSNCYLVDRFGRFLHMEDDKLYTAFIQELLGRGAKVLTNDEFKPEHSEVEATIANMMKAGCSVEEVNSYLDSVRSLDRYGG